MKERNRNTELSFSLVIFKEAIKPLLRNDLQTLESIQNCGENVGKIGGRVRYPFVQCAMGYDSK